MVKIRKTLDFIRWMPWVVVFIGIFDDQNFEGQISTFVVTYIYIPSGKW